MKTARILAPTKLPMTNKTALTGSTDCKITVAKTPIVAIKTTKGKPTTKKQTVRVKLQTKKLLIKVRE
jgi:hypothetical protein